MSEQRTSRLRPPDEPAPKPSWSEPRYVPPTLEINDDPPTTPFVVRVYDDVNVLEHDANDLAGLGYEPLHVTNQPQRAGAWRIILLWFVALIWQPAPHLVVTYRRRD